MAGLQSNGASSTASKNGEKATTNGAHVSSGRPIKDHPKGEWKGRGDIGDTFDVTEQKQSGSEKADKRPGALANLRHLEIQDFKTLFNMVKGKIKGEKVKDDKTMMMERVIQVVAKLPHNSNLRDKLTTTLIEELWDSLDHPPLSRLGDEYRMPDGSNNNPLMPQMGAAGTMYGRSVPTKRAPPATLPDPSALFDSIFARNEYTEHPNHVSSILWYWATIITHDLFWTDYRDSRVNKASSYLDLSPLYGSNKEMLDTVRTFRDGKLKADSFADKRLLGQPPGVCTLIVMFNRYHNYIAENLAARNESGRFTPPGPELEGEMAEAAWRRYDEDLFQVARLVTSGLYINITLVDYVRNIVNLNRTNTTWTLDPRLGTEHEADTEDPNGVEFGTGNLVSAEFNLCYRWHSCISHKDERWIEQFYGELLGSAGGDKETFTPADMARILGTYEKSIPADPFERTFGGFKRGPDGKFSDDDLADCIASAIDDPAGSFGGRNVPKVMKPVEVMGILHSRKWNLAGLNEFRKHFHLKPYEKFEDINSDPKVHEPLRQFYKTPDDVELYPGIVAEEAKSPMVPGVGIAPTYTISRVVLSDAVCLVRGDRFYTTDFHPRNLTQWGFDEVNYDLKVNQGCVFYKLFTGAFPRHFDTRSVYAQYPMVTAAENRKILKDLGTAEKFDFERPVCNQG